METQGYTTDEITDRPDAASAQNQHACEANGNLQQTIADMLATLEALPPNDPQRGQIPELVRELGNLRTRAKALGCDSQPIE